MAWRLIGRRVGQEDVTNQVHPVEADDKVVVLLAELHALGHAVARAPAAAAPNSIWDGSTIAV